MVVFGKDRNVRILARAELRRGRAPQGTRAGAAIQTLLLLRSRSKCGLFRHRVLKAVADVAPSDERLEQVWVSFLAAFDGIVSNKNSEDQSGGLTPAFDSLPVARALNRMNAAFLINAFGRPPNLKKPGVTAAIARIWIATLYPSASPTLIEGMLPDAASPER